MSNSSKPSQTLQEVFGYSEFRPQQQEIVAPCYQSLDNLLLLGTKFTVAKNLLQGLAGTGWIWHGKKPPK